MQSHGSYGRKGAVLTQTHGREGQVNTEADMGVTRPRVTGTQQKLEEARTEVRP